MSVFYKKSTKTMSIRLNWQNGTSEVLTASVEPGVVTFKIYRDKLVLDDKVIATAEAGSHYNRMWLRQERWWDGRSNDYNLNGSGTNTEVSHIGSVVGSNKSNASNYYITVESVDPTVDNHVYDDEWTD